MQRTKVKLRLIGRPLRKSPGVISNVIRTTIFAQPQPDGNNVVAREIHRRAQSVVAGSPRSHVSKRRRRTFNRPPPHSKGYGPIPHPVEPKQYRPFTGPRPAPKPNTRDVATEIVNHTVTCSHRPQPL